MFVSSLAMWGAGESGFPRYRVRFLPAVVAEGAVRFRHAVRVFALLHRIAAVLRSVHQLARQTARHGLLRAGTRRRDQPADGQRLGALRTDLDGDLIGRTADAARADLDARLHIVQCIVEDADRLALQARFDALERAVNNALGDGLLAVEHDTIHELGEDDVPELRVGKNFALFWAATTGHDLFLSLQPLPEPVRGLLVLDYFGRLAPYLERDCLRSLTPCVS